MAKVGRPSDPDPDGDELVIRHVPLDRVRRWDRNPKRHDFGALIQSITRYGFKDPPKYEPSLNGGEGGIVEGNGRAEALSMMQAGDQAPPRGVTVDADGRWCVPVLFGVDARSRAEAESYGVDHNNLTLSGGDLGIDAIMGLWDESGMTDLLTALGEDGELPVSLDGEDLDALLGQPNFDPVGIDEQGQLDQKAPITCPHCGKEFVT